MSTSLTRPTAEPDNINIRETFTMRDSQIGLGTIFRTCMICIATFLALLVASYVGNANAQPVPNPNVCADIPPGSPDPVLCTKEIRIVNNTEATIYVVLQGSIQQQAALGTCPITSSGEGAMSGCKERSMTQHIATQSTITITCTLIRKQGSGSEKLHQ